MLYLRSSARSLQIQLKLQLIKIFRCFICLKVLLPTHKVQKRKRQKTPWRKQRNFWHIKGEKYSASIFRKNVSRANEACNEEATNVTFFKSSSCLKGSKGGTTWNTATSKLETFISFLVQPLPSFFWLLEWQLWKFLKSYYVSDTQHPVLQQFKSVSDLTATLWRSRLGKLTT